MSTETYREINKDLFSKRLKDLLGTEDENTRSLAEVIRVTPSTISRYANGRISPKITTVQILAGYFDVNPIWLMGYDVPKKSLETQSIKVTAEARTLISKFNKLNEIGKKEAVTRVEELTQIPKYTKEKEYLTVRAAHHDNPNDEEQQRLLQQDIDDL